LTIIFYLKILITICNLLFKVKNIYNTNIILITKQKLVSHYYNVLFFPATMVSISSVYAAIEKEEYTKSICSDYQGEWEDGSCI
jgi:hypothetical protein